MAQEGGWNLDQDKAGYQHSEGPIYCVNNCGLVGNPATMNLCAKCYLSVVLKEPDLFPAKVLGEKSMASAVSEKSLVISTQTGDGSCNFPHVHLTDSQDTAMPLPQPISTYDERYQTLESTSRPSEQIGPSVVPHHRYSSRLVNRCFTCRKRLGLIGFKCRCGDMFCSLHRYSDRHSCSFDYKAAARDAIAKANPVVKAGKIEKI